MTTCTPDPAPAALSPARVEQHLLGAAIRASTLHWAARLALWTAADLAAAAADTGTPFSISIEELSEQSGLPADVVGRHLSHLVEAGWIARTQAGQWLPTVPTPRPAT